MLDKWGHQNVATIAVTARFRLGYPNTRRWLDAHGLVNTGLICAADIHPGDASRVDFKRQAIEHIQQSGKTVVSWLVQCTRCADGLAQLFGVGDRPSDLLAYHSAGVLPVIVAHKNHSSLDAVLKLAAQHGLKQDADFLVVQDQEAKSVWQQIGEMTPEQLGI